MMPARPQGRGSVDSCCFSVIFLKLDFSHEASTQIWGGPEAVPPCLQSD